MSDDFCDNVFHREIFLFYYQSSRFSGCLTNVAYHRSFFVQEIYIFCAFYYYYYFNKILIRQKKERKNIKCTIISLFFFIQTSQISCIIKRNKVLYKKKEANKKRKQNKRLSIRIEKTRYKRKRDIVLFDVPVDVLSKQNKQRRQGL